MGWNDRLPEDPYVAWESTKDADDYEAWNAYMAAEAAAVEAERRESIRRELLEQLRQKIASRKTTIKDA